MATLHCFLHYFVQPFLVVTCSFPIVVTARVVLFTSHHYNLHINLFNYFSSSFSTLVVCKHMPIHSCSHLYSCPQCTFPPTSSCMPLPLVCVYIEVTMPCTLDHLPQLNGRWMEATSYLAYTNSTQVQHNEYWQFSVKQESMPPHVATWKVRT